MVENQTLDENTTTMVVQLVPAMAATVSITCAVHPNNWESCLQYMVVEAEETTSSLHHQVVPTLGVHASMVSGQFIRSLV